MFKLKNAARRRFLEQMRKDGGASAPIATPQLDNEEATPAPKEMDLSKLTEKPVEQQEVMNPSPKFSRLRAKLKGLK